MQAGWLAGRLDDGTHTHTSPRTRTRCLDYRSDSSPSRSEHEKLLRSGRKTAPPRRTVSANLALPCGQMETEELTRSAPESLRSSSAGAAEAMVLCCALHVPASEP